MHAPGSEVTAAADEILAENIRHVLSMQLIRLSKALPPIAFTSIRKGHVTIHAAAQSLTARGGPAANYNAVLIPMCLSDVPRDVRRVI